MAKMQILIPNLVRQLVLDLSRWRHRKRLSTYTILGQARLQIATRPLVEGDTVIVYVSEDTGEWWARLHEEFHDGRFERIDN